MRSAAEQKAQAKYEGKRKSCRLSSVYFSKDEYYLYIKALKKSGGTKKQLIIDAIKCYLNNAD